MQLTPLQQKAVEYVRAHPGSTTTQIGSGIGFQGGSVSAALSQVVSQWPGLLRREKLPRKGRRGGVTFSYHVNGVIPPPVKNEEPRKISPYKKKRRSPARASDVDVLLTLKVGKREALTVTIAEARDLLHQLLSLQRFFGNAS